MRESGEGWQTLKMPSETSEMTAGDPLSCFVSSAGGLQNIIFDGGGKFCTFKYGDDGHSRTVRTLLYARTGGAMPWTVSLQAPLQAFALSVPMSSPPRPHHTRVEEMTCPGSRPRKR